MALTQPQNAPEGSNPVLAAVEAFKSGRDVETAVYGKQGPGAHAPKPAAKAEAPAHEEPADVSADNSSDSENSESNSAQASGAEEIAPAANDTDYVYVTDESGRKKIKVDFADRDKTKKAYEYAYGFRKMQAERDKANSQLKDLEPKYQDMAKSWELMEKAVHDNGLEGLVNLISGDAKGFDKLVEKRMQLSEWKKSATPAELERYDAQQQAEAERRAREKLEKEFSSLRDKVEKDSDTAKFKTLESKVNPAFDKWRFAGKLGDASLEEQLDRAVWNQALDNIEGVRSKMGVEEHELPSTIIEQEFRKVRSTFDKVINKQTEKKTSQIIQQKKAAAQDKVAARATSGMQNNSAQDDFRNKVRSGDFVTAFREAMTGGRRK